LTEFVKDFFTGYVHLWYLFMIIGLYLMVPFLRKICEDMRLTQYFLLLALIFALAVPAVELLPLPGKTTFDYILSNANIYLVLGYSGIFVAGYYFSVEQLSRRFTRTIYLVGFFSVVFTMAMTSYLNVHSGTPNQDLYSYLLPNTCITALAVFLFAKSHLNNLRLTVVRWVSRISRWTFGMYLVHYFFIILLISLGFTTRSFNPIVSVPAITIIVFVASVIVSAVLNHIPRFKRYVA